MVQFGDLTYREIRQYADTGCLALVPTGCTEQQGPHLPVSFDSWLVETVALCRGGRGYPRICHLRARVADAAIRPDP